MVESIPTKPIRLEKIEYKRLKARQKETYNFHRVAAALAEFGYNSLLLSDDWLGADFIAYHKDGEIFYRVQLKSRIVVDQKYFGKGLYIAALSKQRLFVYPHDEVVDRIDKAGRINHTKSWSENRSYGWPGAPPWLLEILSEFEVPFGR